MTDGSVFTYIASTYTPLATFVDFSAFNLHVSLLSVLKNVNFIIEGVVMYVF